MARFSKKDQAAVDACLAKLRTAQQGSDPESDHLNADRALVVLLHQLELSPVADAYVVVKKWYA